MKSKGTHSLVSASREMDWHRDDSILSIGVVSQSSFYSRGRLYIARQRWSALVLREEMEEYKVPGSQ